MIILYFLAAGVAWLHDRRLAKKLNKLNPDEASVLPVDDSLSA
jgi:sec-independent protein translocase protein TatC